MISRGLLALFVFATAPFAGAATSLDRRQIQTEPTEVVTAAAPSQLFSDRAGLWLSEQLPASTFDASDRTTTSDRWNTVPGVQAREQGSPTLSIRGSAQADRVLQLFDGAPLNIADGVGASSLFVPTEVMENVSLLKGPSSVFYGTAAMAGAVDHRLCYFDEPTLSAQLTSSLAGSAQTLGDHRASLVVPFLKSGTPWAQVSVLADRDSGVHREHNSQDLVRATAATDLDLANGFKLSARLVEAHSSGESPGSLIFPLVSAFDQKGSLATLQLSRAMGVSTLASLRFTDTRIWGDYDHGSSSSYVSKSSLFADLNTSLSSSLLIRTFGDFSYDALTASYVGGSHLNQHDSDLGQTYQLSLSPELTLQPAYRYQSRFGELFKSIAALYTRPQFKGRATTSLKYGEGFRAPSLADRFGSYSTFIANPSLQPERSWSVEFENVYVNAKRYGEFLEGFELRASTFYTGFSDLVDTRTSGASFTKINSGDARSLGVELSTTYGYKIWMASAAYSYLDAKNLTTNEPLRLAPRHQAALTLTQLFGPLLFEAKETLWSSFHDRDPLTGALLELPSWTTFDFSIRTVALTNWQLRVGVLNLFDQARMFTYGYPEPLRRFTFSASRSF